MSFKVWSPSWTGIFQDFTDVLYVCISEFEFLCVAQCLSQLVHRACLSLCAFLFDVMNLILEA